MKHTHSVLHASTDAELHLIFRLRYDVYIAEQGKAYPEADHVAHVFTDSWDHASTNLYLPSDDGSIIAAARHTSARTGRAELLAENHVDNTPLAQLGDAQLSFTSRLVVEHSRRGHLPGLHSLIAAIYEHCAVSNEVVNVIHARPQLVPFFRRLGFRSYGNSFVYSPTGSVHQPMLILLDDAQHLRSCNSPVADLAARLFGGKRNKVSLQIERLLFADDGVGKIAGGA